MIKKSNTGIAIGSIVLSAIGIVIVFISVYAVGFSFRASGPTDGGYEWNMTYTFKGFGVGPFSDTGNLHETIKMGLGSITASTYPIKGLLIAGLFFLFVCLILSILVLTNKKYKLLEIGLIVSGALAAILIFSGYMIWLSFVSDFKDVLSSEYVIYSCKTTSGSATCFAPMAFGVAIFGMNLRGAIALAKNKEVEEEDDGRIKANSNYGPDNGPTNQSTNF